MKNIIDLQFGKTDANLNKINDWQFIEKTFFFDETIAKIQHPDNYYLLGEKGAGKTAYANYLSQKNINNFVSKRINISETDYSYFVELKDQKKIILPDYTLLWKNIILYQLLKKIIELDEEILIVPLLNQIFNSPLRKIKEVIKDFEINKYSTGSNITEVFLSEEKRAKLSVKILEVEAKDIESVKKSENNIGNPQENFFNTFINVFQSFKLKHNFIFFIDGLDLKPSQIEFSSFLDCVKGLSYAVEELNIRDLDIHEGKLKIMLLVRPDIFSELGLRNTNLKINSNSVILDWRTINSKLNSSKIFKLIDGILNNQQPVKSALGNSWNHYFNFEINGNLSFQEMLKFTFMRPRDLIQLLNLMKEASLENNFNVNFFTERDFKYSLRNFSNYLLGEIKDQISFYHNKDDYNSLLRLFQFMNGNTSFDYHTFCNDIYANFKAYHQAHKLGIPSFAQSPEQLLQFLFQLNIICYQEKSLSGIFYKWSYKEKGYSDINPQVKFFTKYLIHDGLKKALNTGQKFN